MEGTKQFLLECELESVERFRLYSSNHFKMVSQYGVELYGLKVTWLLSFFQSIYDMCEENNTFFDSERYFFFTFEDMKRKSFLGESEVRSAIDEMKRFNLISIKKPGGDNKKNYYKINHNTLIQDFDKLVKQKAHDRNNNSNQ